MRNGSYEKHFDATASATAASKLLQVSRLGDVCYLRIFFLHRFPVILRRCVATAEIMSEKWEFDINYLNHRVNETRREYRLTHRYRLSSRIRELLTRNEHATRTLTILLELLARARASPIIAKK